jgi:hypothetical protein
MSSRINMFKFKYYNSILGFNTRVAHFNPEVEAGCTFCKLTGPFRISPDTFIHLSYDWPTVHRLIAELFRKYFGIQTISREHYFPSTKSEKEQTNVVVNIILDTFR